MNTKKLLLIFLITFGLQANASITGNKADQLQHDWAVANYQLQGDEKSEAFETLIQLTNDTRAKNPNDVSVLIWEGIIKSTYAGVKGGIGALSLAKESRSALEKAIKIDGKALDGAAYTSLGTLYFKMPGWPLAFGDNDKAKKLLDTAISIDPNGIDSNYFYADYLISQKQYKDAEKYLLKAQQAEPRPGRDIADKGRQTDIQLALNLVHKMKK